jgi:hypothetical protein
MIELVLAGALVGIGATIAMDVWAILLNRVAGLDLPNWALVGRWFWHLGKGSVFHDDISAAQPYAKELGLGWLAHYAVGIIYGTLFVLIMGSAWLAAPAFVPAWIFGLVTVGAGWFLLQPGLGLGWAASKTENPWMVRALNLLAHTAFALGLWVTALVIH